MLFTYENTNSFDNFVFVFDFFTFSEIWILAGENGGQQMKFENLKMTFEIRKIEQKYYIELYTR